MVDFPNRKVFIECEPLGILAFHNSNVKLPCPHGASQSKHSDFHGSDNNTGDPSASLPSQLLGVGRLAVDKPFQVPAPRSLKTRSVRWKQRASAAANRCSSWIPRERSTLSSSTTDALLSSSVRSWDYWSPAFCWLLAAVKITERTSSALCDLKIAASRSSNISWLRI